MFSFWHGDIRDVNVVDNLMRHVDVVVHMAAETHVDRSIENPNPFVDTDVRGTQVLLEAIRQHPVERFIHISTSEVYGTAQAIPMTEEHPLLPQSPYAGAKAGADRLAYSYYVTYNLPIIILRPFNNYGPHQYPEKLLPPESDAAGHRQQSSCGGCPGRSLGISGEEEAYVERRVIPYANPAKILITSSSSTSDHRSYASATAKRQPPRTLGQ